MYLKNFKLSIYCQFFFIHSFHQQHSVGRNSLRLPNANEVATQKSTANKQTKNTGHKQVERLRYRKYTHRCLCTSTGRGIRKYIQIDGC